MRATSRTTTWVRRTACGLALAALSACGGNSDGASVGERPPPDPGSTIPTSYPISGTINGLAGAVTLRWSTYSDEQTFTGNGPFSFAEQSAPGNPYSVEVVRQPDGQTCSVANGFGTDVRAIADLVVSCVDASARFAVGGAISGLTGTGLRIEAGPANAFEPPPGATGFTLPMGLGNAVAYDVGIATQPTGQTCVVLNASGMIDAADVEDVEVRCIANATDPLAGTYFAPGLQPGSYVYVALFPDGVYQIATIQDDPNCEPDTHGNGVEYGVYKYDAATHWLLLLSATVDTNGGCGGWDNDQHRSRYDGTLTVSGSGASSVLTLTPSAGGATLDLVPVPSVESEIVGSWAAPYQKSMLVFMPAGGRRLHYLMTETQTDPPPLQTGAVAGIEYGCASVDTMNGGRLDVDFSAACDAPTPTTAGPRETNGLSGLWPGRAAEQFTVSGDTMTLNGVEYRRLRAP